MANILSYVCRTICWVPFGPVWVSFYPGSFYTFLIIPPLVFFKKTNQNDHPKSNNMVYNCDFATCLYSAKFTLFRSKKRYLYVKKPSCCKRKKKFRNFHSTEFSLAPATGKIFSLFLQSRRESLPTFRFVVFWYFGTSSFTSLSNKNVILHTVLQADFFIHEFIAYSFTKNIATYNVDATHNS
jgi:hypothetical protein